MNKRWVAKCGDCKYQKFFKTLNEASRALELHFDTHLYKDLPVGGRIEYKNVFLMKEEE